MNTLENVFENEIKSDTYTNILANQPGPLEQYCKNIEINGCKKCHLGYESKQVVSRGNLYSKLMIVGQNPGYQELQEGYPFVGPSGKLLDEILTESGLIKTQPYITNVGLCGTPNNRPLTVEESQACKIHFNRQFFYLAPKIILAVGRPAIQHICPETKNEKSLKSCLHKVFIHYNNDLNTKVPVRFIYHPSYLLRKKGTKEFESEYENCVEVCRQILAFLKDSKIEPEKEVLF